MGISATFAAVLWEHEGAGAWHFVSLPEELSDAIEAMHGHHAAGFGSLRVEVAIGATAWRTSIFPDSKRRTYLLPVKKAVRKAEGVAADDTVSVAIEVLDPG